MEATTFLPIQRLVPVPLPLLSLSLLQLWVPCHSLFRMLTLLKQLCFEPLSCRHPLRRHPLRGCALGGRPPPRQQLLRYCPPRGPSPHILPFLALSHAALPSATLPLAPTPPAATPTTVLSSVAPRRPPAPPSTRCAATRRADTRCPAPPDATQTNAMPPVATSHAARSPASGAFAATAVRRSARSLAARQRDGDRDCDRTATATARRQRSPRLSRGATTATARLRSL